MPLSVPCLVPRLYPSGFQVFRGYFGVSLKIGFGIAPGLSQFYFYFHTVLLVPQLLSLLSSISVATRSSRSTTSALVPDASYSPFLLTISESIEVRELEPGTGTTEQILKARRPRLLGRKTSLCDAI